MPLDRRLEDSGMYAMSRKRCAVLCVNLLAAFAPAYSLDLPATDPLPENPPPMLAAVEQVEPAPPPATRTESRLDEAVADVRGQVDYYQWATRSTMMPKQSVTALAAM